MATITMNLSIEKGVAARIKKYAISRNTSVSSIAENFFLLVTTTPMDGNEQEVSPLVKSFSINDVNIPADFDYKKELAIARNEKYL